MITSQFSGYSLDTDIRELDVRKCIRGFMDGTNIGTMGECSTASNATLTFFDSCSPSELGYAQIANAVSTGVSRAWISDRNGLTNSGFAPGLFECDSFAKVRIPLHTTVNGGVVRVGFFPGHIGSELYGGGAYFHCNAVGSAGAATTWSIVLAVNQDAIWTSTPYLLVKDTGVLVSSWATLGVWINKDATEVLWYINGKVVYKETNPDRIPSVGKMGGSLGAATAGAGLQCGASFRMQTSNTETAVVLKVDVEWCRYRYYMER
jgi:hypothetical protein